ncbi:hypothetical protein MHAE_02845 [Mycobacterium haemophilum DSM 44634]|uniref:hypothetical protein n=1 Tax=Mycobacterium haemophilum TaxID=29311 RepID=UPI0006D5BF04|nr:hypothetical protein [Mycobacterium haemophilum]
MLAAQVTSRRNAGYTIMVLLLVLWLAALVVLAIAFEPDLYWFSYYSVDYTLGFVRRGLAGEMLDLFPAGHYFTGLHTLRWLSSTFFIGGLVAVAVRFGRSERRLMLALLIAVLPFGFAFAVLSAHPDLFAGAALAGFAVTLASVKGDRSILFASATYGVTIAVLTLAHEAIPSLFSLGAVLAIATLAAHSSINIQRISALLAVAPGLAVAVAAALLGRRGISSQLCAMVPHGAVDWPAAGKLSASQILSGQHFYIDYHDWMCRNIIMNFDQTFADAARFVASIGAGLLASTAFGIALLTMTVLAIGHVSGVPFRRFCELPRRRLWWVTFAAVLMLPVFATSVDWVRWWVTISFDIGIVYLLYASSQPEATQEPTRRTRVVFAVGVMLLALFPVGVIPGFGVPPPV